MFSRTGMCKYQEIREKSCPLQIKRLRFPQVMTGMKLKTKAEPPPENRRLGYARVSTYGQTLDAQLEQLRAERCGRIYREKGTGAHNDRRQLLKMLAPLPPGDVVTVTRIDRLARSTFDLFAIVKQIVDAKAQFRSLAEPWARHWHQHRAADDCCVGRIGGRGARPYTHPHRRGPRAGAEARAAHGATAEIDTGAESRGPTATGGGCYTCRTCAQRWRGKEYDFEGDGKVGIVARSERPTLSSGRFQRNCFAGGKLKMSKEAPTLKSFNFSRALIISAPAMADHAVPVEIIGSPGIDGSRVIEAAGVV